MPRLNGILLIIISILLIVSLALSNGLAVALLGLALIQQVRIIAITRIVSMQEKIAKMQNERIRHLTNNENKNP